MTVLNNVVQEKSSRNPCVVKSYVREGAEQQEELFDEGQMMSTKTLR